jgi:hypothetical protein
MGLAQSQIVPQGEEWGVLHDGYVKNRYATKEAAFEAAVAAASLAIREGHEVHISVPDRSSRNQTAPRGEGSGPVVVRQRCHPSPPMSNRGG